MLYERTALSRKPEKLIREELDALRKADELTPDLVFKDPYLLDFLGLRDTFSEKDLESARSWRLVSSNRSPTTSPPSPHRISQEVV